VIGAVDLGDSDRGTGALPVPELISDALAEYRHTHGHQPARIVLHKTSQFSPAEVAGFQATQPVPHPGGIVKVLDFGVAALLGAGELIKLTMTGQTVGTPSYMAPEQAPRPGEPSDCRAGTRGCTPDSAAHVKPEHATSAARPWPSAEKPTVRTDRPGGTDARPLYVRGHRNTAVHGATR
jgi:serine/threonine protein kinase